MKPHLFSQSTLDVFFVVCDFFRGGFFSLFHEKLSDCSCSCKPVCWGKDLGFKLSVKIRLFKFINTVMFI